MLSMVYDDDTDCQKYLVVFTELETNSCMNVSALAVLIVSTVFEGLIGLRPKQTTNEIKL